MKRVFSDEAKKNMSIAQRRNCGSDQIEKRIMREYRKLEKQNKRILTREIAKGAKCSREKVCHFLNEKNLPTTGSDGFHRRKKVRGIELKTGKTEIFVSQTAAAKELRKRTGKNFLHGGVSRACNRKIQHHGWKFHEVV